MSSVWRKPMWSKLQTSLPRSAHSVFPSRTPQQAPHIRCVIHGDFFDLWPNDPSGLNLPPPYGPVSAPAELDALIGNPPYVRFESRTADDRAAVHAVLQRQYTTRETRFPNFTGKADLWAFFIAHGHVFLKQGARLAFVLSTALLNTT